MSTSLLYHAFGIRGYTYRKTEYRGGEVHFTVEASRQKLRCVACGSHRVIRKGGRWRRFRGLPIGRRPVWVRLRVPRLGCKACGTVRQAEIPFAPGQHRYTKRFARYVLDLAALMTMEDVARHLGVSWGLVKEILKTELQRRFGTPSLRDLRRIAIDEISIERGHRYLTVVLDLDSGAVVFVGAGKGADALDPFHVVKLMNDKLSALRRELQREAEAEAKAVLKGTRWLLLKNPENLAEERDEAARLRRALELNAPLAAAYYLKEELRQLRQMANTLSIHREGVLAYYDVPITTGPLEGTNTKIQLLKRKAYGYHDQEFFKLRIYGLHETRYELVG